MKNINKIKWRMFVSILALTVIIIITYTYVKQLNYAVTKNTEVNVTEMAEHDIKSIMAYIDLMWEYISNAQTRLASYDCDTMEEVQEWLNLECESSLFDTLYLVSEDGTVYTDKLIHTKDEFDIRPYFAEGKDKYVGIFNDTTHMGMKNEEMLIYVVRTENFELNGKNIVGIAGLCQGDTMQELLSISSFQGRGYSSVVDNDGNYLVTVDQTGSLNMQGNLYERLEAGRFLDDNSVDTVRNNLIYEQKFMFQYIDKDGVQKSIYCAPVEDTDLNFLLVVPNQVFSEQIQTFFRMSIIMLGMTLGIILLVFVYIYISSQKMFRINAQIKVRNEFLTNMSHEIRTPLNGLLGLNHLAKVHMDERDKLQEYLDKAHSTAKYLLALLNDVLDMAKFQSEKVDVVREPINIERIIDEVWSMQNNNISSRGIEFIVQKDVEFPYIVGDEIRIKQVIMNIVGNAAKFTPAGGYIKLSVAQKKDGDAHVQTTIVCEDTGCGMSSDFLEHIWEPFSQNRSSNSNGVKGTGLGMAISHTLVEAMGGKISVESELDIGSTFTVVLPSDILENAPEKEADDVKQEDTRPNTLENMRENALGDTQEKTQIDIQENVCESIAEDGQATELTGADHKPLNVLIAEDVELNAEILMEILTDEGFSVTHAVNGKETVDIFSKSEIGEFDVILMDMQMPVMDGCQAAQAIRKLERPDAKTVFIFACTANTFQEDRENATMSGMDDFIMKPIDVNVLLGKLEKLSK